MWELGTRNSACKLAAAPKTPDSKNVFPSCDPILELQVHVQRGKSHSSFDIELEYQISRVTCAQGD